MTIGSRRSRTSSKSKKSSSSPEDLSTDGRFVDYDQTVLATSISSRHREQRAADRRPVRDAESSSVQVSRGSKSVDRQSSGRYRQMDRKLKLVVVGDSYVGKTSLLFAYTQKQFLDSYATTVFDNWAISINIENKDYTVNLFDTAGQEDYENLRCLSYPHTDVFLLCFSMVQRSTLEACQKTWIQEIRKYAGDTVPVILVGTKEDLLDSTPEREAVTFEMARRAAADMDCSKFLACSSLTHRNLKRVFDEAFLLAIGASVPSDDPRNCCCLQ